MPIYEYQCVSCLKVSEFFLRVSDPHPNTCPKCGRQTELRKQISQTSFSLRGEGWYVTDYKQAPKVSAESAKVEEPKEEGGKNETKTADSAPKPAQEKTVSGEASTGSSSAVQAAASSSAKPQ